jgi:hypothetical protein
MKPCPSGHKCEIQPRFDSNMSQMVIDEISDLLRFDRQSFDWKQCWYFCWQDFENALHAFAAWEERQPAVSISISKSFRCWIYDGGMEAVRFNRVMAKKVWIYSVARLAQDSDRVHGSDQHIIFLDSDVGFRRAIRRVGAASH